MCGHMGGFGLVEGFYAAAVISCRGRVTWKAAPPLGLSSTSIVPPCAATSLADNVEPEPEAGDLADGCFPGSVEGGEDAIPVLKWDARTVVTDSQENMLVRTIDAKINRDRAADRTVFDRIANEVVDDLVQPIVIPRADDCPAVIGELHRMPGCPGLSRNRNVVANRDDVGRLKTNIKRARTQAGNLQQVIDQPGHAVDVAGNRSQPFHLLFVLAFPDEVAFDELDESPDRRHRRAQFMRHD